MNAPAETVVQPTDVGGADEAVRAVGWWLAVRSHNPLAGQAPADPDVIDAHAQGGRRTELRASHLALILDRLEQATLALADTEARLAAQAAGDVVAFTVEYDPYEYSYGSFTTRAVAKRRAEQCWSGYVERDEADGPVEFRWDALGDAEYLAAHETGPDASPDAVDTGLAVRRYVVHAAPDGAGQDPELFAGEPEPARFTAPLTDPADRCAVAREIERLTALLASGGPRAEVPPVGAGNAAGVSA